MSLYCRTSSLSREWSVVWTTIKLESEGSDVLTLLICDTYSVGRIECHETVPPVLSDPTSCRRREGVPGPRTDRTPRSESGVPPESRDNEVGVVQEPDEKEKV